MNNKNLNILIVEDDIIDATNIKQVLEMSDNTKNVYVAPNGLEALKMLRPTDGKLPLIAPYRRLIVLDINLPTMNGIEFLQHLRSEPQLNSIPVVVLTGASSDRYVLEAYQLNVAGYIVKPVNFNSFIEALTTLSKYWVQCEMA
ncbi:response regulator [Candidatus Gracilibacteria bacterium]|jgi:CheY-like chemotaxis protein|nr:response regulator [Candidatus Gracilibacteria bacterium]NJM86595.1 response regulator [Hydrococcus sp. RU_2_2]NJP22333.1 response regulator [Hydrococcus sp. CRU_1_1]